MKNSILTIALIVIAAIALVFAFTGFFGNKQADSPLENQNGSMPISQSEQMESNQMENINSSNNTMEQETNMMQDIVGIAAGSKDHTTLVAAVKAAGLVETLQGEGPFTVFAPVNSAFEALPAGTLDSLLMPENKDQLVGILTYHVVPTKAMSADVVKMITEGGGSAHVKTVAGGTLTLMTSGGKVTVTDESGNVATVTVADLEASNGVIHVVDKVLLPHS